MLHCYAPANATIVDLVPGSGMKAVAACRAGMRYISFIQNDLHGSLVKETALLPRWHFCFLICASSALKTSADFVTLRLSHGR